MLTKSSLILQLIAAFCTFTVISNANANLVGTAVRNSSTTTRTAPKNTAAQSQTSNKPTNTLPFSRGKNKPGGGLDAKVSAAAALAGASGAVRESDKKLSPNLVNQGITALANLAPFSKLAKKFLNIYNKTKGLTTGQKNVIVLIGLAMSGEAIEINGEKTSFCNKDGKPSCSEEEVDQILAAYGMTRLDVEACKLNEAA